MITVLRSEICNQWICLDILIFYPKFSISSSIFSRSDTISNAEIIRSIHLSLTEAVLSLSHVYREYFGNQFWNNMAYLHCCGTMQQNLHLIIIYLQLFGIYNPQRTTVNVHYGIRLHIAQIAFEKE